VARAGMKGRMLAKKKWGKHFARRKLRLAGNYLSSRFRKKLSVSAPQLLAVQNFGLDFQIDSMEHSHAAY
jgi:hypothetical protein